LIDPFHLQKRDYKLFSIDGLLVCSRAWGSEREIEKNRRIVNDI
jgi:hypothetical protein